jgi:predicted DNA-binding transcriptional regulator YafY
MANSKQAPLRYQIIDRELRRNDYVKTTQLVHAIDRTLGFKVSSKTVNNDINDLINDPILEAPIDYCDSRKAYFYKNKNYTISKFGLKEEDINALFFYAQALSQYKDYEVFKDFSSAIEKIMNAADIRRGITETEKARIIVQTENTSVLVGNKWIPKIVEALNNNSLIEIEYQKFGISNSKKSKLHPYLLKEDRHRWYLIGMNDKGIVTFGLDRIVDLTVLAERFIPCNFDFEEYFKYSFGITVDGDIENVILKFTAFQGNYLKTLKIHPTQEVLIDDEDEFTISVKVQPSWEFYEKILGYGKNVQVLSPPKVINQYKKILKKITSLY